jgi:hypothetical protein
LFQRKAEAFGIFVGSTSSQRSLCSVGFIIFLSAVG